MKRKKKKKISISHLPALPGDEDIAVRGDDEFVGRFGRHGGRHARLQRGQLVQHGAQLPLVLGQLA